MIGRVAGMEKGLEEDEGTTAPFTGANLRPSCLDRRLVLQWSNDGETPFGAEEVPC
jgi:hypothetical protein